MKNGLLCIQNSQKVAREEGFTRIANLFEMVAKIEQEHDARYNFIISKYSRR